MKLKERLTEKDKALFKLAIWVALAVWMVMIVTISIPWALTLKGLAFKYWGEGVMGGIMSWVLPIWIVFTVLLAVYAIARWAGRKLS